MSGGGFLTWLRWRLRRKELAEALQYYEDYRPTEEERREAEALRNSREFREVVGRIIERIERGEKV